MPARIILWSIACNGKQLRLLRDAATLTRPSFLEIDLARPARWPALCRIR
jgi:hypothetical protein